MAHVPHGVRTQSDLYSVGQGVFLRLRPSQGVDSPSRLAGDYGIILDDEHVLVRWSTPHDARAKSWRVLKRSQVEITHDAIDFRARRIPVTINSQDCECLVLSWFGHHSNVPVVRVEDQSWVVLDTHMGIDDFLATHLRQAS